jgi:phosphate transport system permease protein
MPGASATSARETGRSLLFDTSARTAWRLGFDRVAGWLLPLLFLVAILPIVDLVWYVASQALPTLSWAAITNTNPHDPYALGVPVVSSILVMLWATGLAVLLGLFGGIATAEFLSERWAGWARMSANLLVGTPSVVIGYFGYFALVLGLGWRLSFIAGATTLAFFMTPYIFRVTDLAYSSIPRPIREAAFGSGARPYQYIVRVAAPIAFPQIMNGVFLAVAIGVGETAPIVLTSTHSVLIPQTLNSPVTFLTATIWLNFSQPPGPALALAFQAAFIVLVVVVALNILVRLISARYQKRLEGLYQ